MNREPRTRAPAHSRVLIWFAAGGALAFLGLYLGVALSRLTHPYALEIMEEALAAASLRLRHGEPLWAEPTLDWVPLIYGPVYPALGATMFAVFGEQLWCLRLISLVASVWAIASVWRTGADLGRPAGGILAAGFFAATYTASGGWFDLARVDTLYVALLLASWRTLRRGNGRWPWLSAVFGVLAVFTKQNALPMCAAMGVGLVFADRGRGLRYLALFMAGVLLAGGALHVASGGWSTFFLWSLPGSHPMEWERLPGVLAHDLAVQLPGFLLLATIGAGVLLATADRRRHFPLLAVALVAVNFSLLARVRSGGWLNVLIPMHAFVAVLAGFGLVAVNQALRGTGTRVLLGRIALLGLVAAQLVVLAHESSDEPGRPALRHLRLLPSAEARAQGDRLFAALRSVREPVLAPSHALLAWQAGHPLQAEGTAAWDVWRGGDEELAARLVAALQEGLAAGRWRALLVDEQNRRLPAPLHPREVPAFPPGEHMHTMRPEGDRDFGFERLWWRLRADDEELLQRLQPSASSK